MTGVPESARAHVLGSEACIWSEYTWNEYDLAWKLWSRAFVMGVNCAPVKPVEDDPVPEKVTKRVELLKDGDLAAHWYTWTQRCQKRDCDPDRVFVAEGSTLKVSGADMGCVTTRKAYRDYRLTLEFRFVDTDVQLNKTAARDGGILFHSKGPDGSYGPGIWMASIEYNLIQGACGRPAGASSCRARASASSTVTSCWSRFRDASWNGMVTSTRRSGRFGKSRLVFEGADQCFRGLGKFRDELFRSFSGGPNGPIAVLFMV